MCIRDSFQTLGKQMTEELAKQLVNQGKARLTHCYSKKSNRYYDTTVHVETGAVSYTHLDVYKRQH